MFQTLGDLGTLSRDYITGRLFVRRQSEIKWRIILRREETQGDRSKSWSAEDED